MSIFTTTYIPKNLYKVRTKNGETAIVKANADFLEKLFEEDRILGWSVMEVIKIKEV